MANKYAHFGEPEATLDFHDELVFDRATVKRMTESFIRDAVARGLQRVRIVTGKGLHSSGPPLVGPQVRRTLEQLRREGAVARFADAKVRDGGEGAVDVVLGAAG